MSIEIGGITYEQPGDKATATYAQIDGVIGYVGNAGKRVVKTELAQASHTHSNEILYPSQIVRYSGATYLYLNAGAWIAMRLDANAHIEFLPKEGYYFDILGATRVKRDATISYAFEITGTAGTRNARADAWDLWACSLQDKTNVAEISDPASRLANIRGLTYEREGKAETGFVVEDIEKTLLPGSVYTKDGKIESYNPLSILALAVQTINNQAAAITDLQERVSALEARVK